MTKNYISEVSMTLRRLTFLFSISFDITDKKNIYEYYYFSIILEILVHLNDLAQKLKTRKNGICFSDDIPKTEYYEDITSLVAHFRNAACHNNSRRRVNKEGYIFACNVFAAYSYRDDISILMGDSELLVKRHLVRLYREVLQKFADYKEFQENETFSETIKSAKFIGHF